MVMTPPSGTTDNARVASIIRAVTSLVIQVAIVALVFFLAYKGEWQWAYLWLGIFAMAYLIDIRDAIRKL